MTQLAFEGTFDTFSTDGTCNYNPHPLGGTPFVATTIKVHQETLKGYTSASVLDNAPGVKINPISPLPCQPGIRVIVPTMNTTVFFEKKLFAVLGDKAQMFGSDRPLTGPYKYPRIVIGSRV